MIRGTVEVTINRPPKEVFGFISDPRSELVWNHDARVVEKVSPGPIGVGTQLRGTYRGAGTMDIEVTEYEPNHRTVSKGDSSLMGYTREDDFEDLNGATKVRRSMSGVFKGPMKLLEPLMSGPFRKRFSRSGLLIKEALESGRGSELQRD